MHKKFIFLLSSCIAYGATPPIELVSGGGDVALYAINTGAAMASFSEEINPVKERMIQILNILKDQESSIRENLSQRLTMISPGKITPEYTQLVTACTTMGYQMREKMAELEQCKGILEGKRVPATRNLHADVLHSTGPRVSKREQRLVDSGKKNKVGRTGGFLVPVSDTFVPAQVVDTNTPVQDQYEAILLKHKNEYLSKLIELLSKNQQDSEAFCTWITFREDILSYNIHKFYSDESPERLDLLLEYSKKLSKHPGATPESKVTWREIYRGHLEELRAQNTVSTSPEAREAQKEKERVAAALLAAEEQKALDERRVEQARIRELKADPSAESSDDGEAAPSAAAETVKPKEVESLLGEVSLKAQTKKIINAAIEEIKHGRKPVNYRDTIQECRMPYKGKDRLVHHCGLEGPMRLYYVFTKKNVLLLNVSDHDMERLKQICSSGYPDQ